MLRYVLVLAFAMCTTATAHAAEIKVMASGALKLVMPRLMADFQTSSGNAATIEYGPAGAIADRIRKGDAADVAIVTRSQFESLEGQGKIVKGTGADVAGIAIGVAVRKGAPKPDIGTVEAFKRALLAARSIGYRDPATGSTSGTYTARMIEQLGIAQQLQPKVKLDNSNGDRPEDVFQALMKGDIDMQIGQISEIVLAPGVELAGPLPAGIQKVTTLTAGVTASSKAPEAAKAFVHFLSSPSATAVLKANGFQSTANN